MEMAAGSKTKTRDALMLATCLGSYAMLGQQAHAQAQDVAAFYRGKTIELNVGYPPGGSNDIYARAVARGIGHHIPGSPNVIVRNMPGAGSIRAANYIYNLAPKDGSVLGLVAATNILDEKLGTVGVKFETAKFTWIGRIASAVNVTALWNTVPVKTIQEAMVTETKIGATGTGSTVFIYPNVLNRVLGTKFKLVLGYGGSSEAMLAMERGEMDGHSTSWEAYKSTHPDWIKDKKINVVVQYALKRHPDLPDVPTCVELARTPEEAQILKTVMNATEIGKTIISTPDLPPARAAALRKAFMDMTKDADFIQELENSRVELIPMPGEELQKLVEDVG
ncbi:MAG: tripartite tricarboxylate transporter family receptor, partial [Hyphomicrobiales bacterium]|nr:tripartite tricarboxylate transporter family receptor [Hyphomicrobiales bacterium]